MSYTNPNINFHINLLKSQQAVFLGVYERMIKEKRYEDARELSDELVYLNMLITILPDVYNGSSVSFNYDGINVTMKYHKGKYYLTPKG